MDKSLYIFISALIVAKLFLVIFNPYSIYSDGAKEKIIWGEWSEQKINNLLEKTKSSENKNLLISEAFLGTRYLENTLTGDKNTPEILTINFEGMDCFTYLDYVESLSHSENFNDFKTNLIDTRYKEKSVSYENRKHFFSDWLTNPGIVDVTKKVAGNEAKTVSKNLNKKSETELFLEGIPIVERKITFIPSDHVDSDTIEKLKTGDYIGIYTERKGLDVSHNGIFVKNNNQIYFRHASSKEKNRKVLDEDFLDYISSKPGIVVYRRN